MKIDFVLNMGDVLTVIAFVATSFVVFYNMGRRLDRLEAKVNIMFAWFMSRMGDSNPPDPGEFFKR